MTVPHPDERADLLPLLRAIDAGADLASRAAVPGHVTCGTVVIDDLGRVLVLRHKTLNRWLLPGGHLEPADTDLLAAALRELHEETGIPERWIGGLPDMDAVPLDIDVHNIPADPAKGEPGHWHADFRYAFRVDSPEVRPQLDEITDYRWRLPAELHTRWLTFKIEHLGA
ncbi:MAG: NUDIX domain-containing protein [Streptosporangiales bacterium]|nr:NUDIX domain-containing protein [Streptosporangiales bacterium]